MTTPSAGRRAAVVGGLVVGEQRVLDERLRVEQQVDAFAGRQLVLAADLGQRPLVGLQGPRDRRVDLLAHASQRYALDGPSSSAPVGLRTIGRR